MSMGNPPNLGFIALQFRTYYLSAKKGLVNDLQMMMMMSR